MRDLPTSQLKHLADRIHAGLRRIHTKKVQGADTDFCLAEAFDVCAAAVRDCGYELNDEVVREDIPVLIAHCAKALRWLSAVPAEQWTEFLVKSMTSRAAHWRAESVVSQESQSSPLVQQNGIVPRRFTWVEVWREMPEALHSERMYCLAADFLAETGAGWRRILSRKLEGADTDLCLREGYDVTAAALRDCSRALELNDKVLRGSIPKWILDHYGEELLAAVPPDQRHEYLMNRVMGRIAWWQAEELQKGSKYKSEYKGQCTLYERWEAKQELGRINDGPHESIPESFVRAHLALQFDIKPAEVTWKQILVEVERLSFRSECPAVELVPTAPATAGDHGPWFFVFVYRPEMPVDSVC